MQDTHLGVPCTAVLPTSYQGSDGRKHERLQGRKSGHPDSWLLSKNDGHPENAQCYPVVIGKLALYWYFNLSDFLGRIRAGSST